MDDTLPKKAKLETHVAPQCDVHTRWWQSANESKVLHVTGLAHSTKTMSEAELVGHMCELGAVSLSQPLTANCCYVEFESVQAARRCVQRTREGALRIDQWHTLWLAYAPRQHLPRIGLETIDQCNILSICVREPSLPINTDILQCVLSTRVSPPSPASRIVIRRRQALVAYVEFRDSTSALRAKHQLQAATLYSHACSIRAEFAAALHRLAVRENDHMTWCYVGLCDAQCGDEIGYDVHGRPVYEPGYVPAAGVTPAEPVHVADAGSQSADLPNKVLQMLHYAGLTAAMQMDDDSSIYNAISEHFVAPIPDGSGVNFQHSVVLVLRLPAEFDCDAMFNLCCLYGNVMRVKFVVQRPGMAFVQMGDRIACHRLIVNMCGCKVFGSILEFVPSNIAYIDDTYPSPPLPSGKPSYTAFDGSLGRNTYDARNRFMSAEHCAKGRIVEPGPVLYAFGFAGVTLGGADDLLHMVFDCNNVPRPEAIHMIAARSGQRPAGAAAGYNALFVFASVEQATDALCMLNHVKVSIPHERPFILRLSFCAKSLVDTVMANAPLRSSSADCVAGATPASDHSHSGAHYCA